LWLSAGRRKPTVLLVALFVALLGFEDDWSFQRSSDRSSDPPSMAVLALNVRHYRAGRLQVAEAIKSMDPDVVLITENHFADRDALEEFESALAPYAFRYGRSDEAAIASRLPIVEATEVDLPTRAPTLHHPNRVEDQPSHPHRSFMHARVDF